MIDFSPVYEAGLIVHCETLEDSIAFFKEVRAQFGRQCINIEDYTPYALESFHIRKGDNAAYRISKVDEDVVICRASYSWYRELPKYNGYTFVDFYSQNVVDCDDVFDDEVDISYLLGGGDTQ